MGRIEIIYLQTQAASCSSSGGYETGKPATDQLAAKSSRESCSEKQSGVQAIALSGRMDS
jgi:hypothetical protein